MPAASITTSSTPAFRVPTGAFGFRVRNLSDTTIYWRDSQDVDTSGANMGMPLDPGQEHVECYDKDNKNPRSIMMIHGSSGSKSIVYDFLQVQVSALAGTAIAATVTVNPGDIEIGAVEIKDGSTDTRAIVDASTGALTTQPPVPTKIMSTALEASRVIKASAGSLVSLSVFNSKASSQFILIMNSASVPADGAVTLLFPPIPIAAASMVSIEFPRPLVASTGISVCNSSTGTFTKTIGSADCVFLAQYL